MRRSFQFILLSAAALLASAAGHCFAADTTPFYTNLVNNGDGDSSPGSSSFYTQVPIPGWTVTGNFNLVRYDASGSDLSTAVSSAVNGGDNYFAGGQSNDSSSASQSIPLSNRDALIDAGILAAYVSADLGGYDGQDDHIVLSLTFFDAADSTISSISFPTVYSADRNGINNLLPRSGIATLPANTRTILLTMLSTRTSGSDNDGLADNVALSLSLLGDANQDGQINGDDYTLIDRGYANHLTGYSNGDFNLDGSVTPADYLLIDRSQVYFHTLSPAFLAQRESQFGDAYVSELLTNLPEPSCLIFLLPLWLFSPHRSRGSTLF